MAAAANEANLRSGNYSTYSTNDSEGSPVNSIELAIHRRKTGSSSDGSSSRSMEAQMTTLRLNPAVVKQKGLKLFAPNRHHLHFTEGTKASGLADPEDHASSLRSVANTSAHSVSSSVFSDMFSVGCLGKRESHALENREAYKMPPKQVTWWQVTLYLLNDIIGSWLMLFSAIMLGLYGWILGILLLAGLWPINMFVGHLLWRCRNVFPGAISVGDLVYYMTKSSWAMYITFFFVNLTILLTLANLMVTSSSNLYWLSGYTSGKCSVAFLAGVSLILFPVAQLRTLHSLTWLNMINLVCMLCFVGIFIYFIASPGVAEGAQTRIGINKKALDESIDMSGSMPRPPLLGVDTMIAAYHYQLLILEIVAEMRNPREFPKANYWCTPVVLFVTLSCAASRYYFEGETAVLAIDRTYNVVLSVFETDVKSLSILAYFAMICFTIQMLGSCLVRTIVLIRSCQLLIHPRAAHINSCKARLEWAGISLVILALAWALSLSLRHAALASLICGTLALLTSLLLPCVLYIICTKQTGKPIPWIEWLMIIGVLLLCLVVLVLYFAKLGWRVSSDEFIANLANRTRWEIDVMTDCTSLS